MKKYESAHGATRKLTGAQKLAELACERIAHRDGQSLPARFWTEPSWVTVFTTQLRFANSLLKVYDEEVVFRAFHDADASRVWSLGAPFFKKTLDKHRELYARELEKADRTPANTTSTSNPTASPRRSQAPGQGDSVRAKLNRLNGSKKDTGSDGAAD